MKMGTGRCVVLSFVWMAAISGFAQAPPAPTSPAAMQQLPPVNGALTGERAKRFQDALKDYHGPDYVRFEAMIPVRDGAKLHTIIIRPVASDTTGPALPFLMTRTPYGVAGSSEVYVKFSKPDLAQSGY